jgi:Integrase core domain
LNRLPFKVEVIQTDNGAEFHTAFHWHVLDKGIGHVYFKPRTPRLNGKVERSHRIDAKEFYRLRDGVVIDDTKMFNDKLQEWEDYYNYHRPHGALDGQTPYERLRQKTHPAVADLPQRTASLTLEDSQKLFLSLGNWDSTRSLLAQLAYVGDEVLKTLW